MKVKSESEVAQLSPTQRPHGLQPTRLLRPWEFPGKSTGVGCHCLLLPRNSLLLTHSIKVPPVGGGGGVEEGGKVSINDHMSGISGIF